MVAKIRERSKNRNDDRNNEVKVGVSQAVNRKIYNIIFVVKQATKKYCFKWTKENKVLNNTKEKRKDVNEKTDSVNLSFSNDLLIVYNNMKLT